MMVESGGNPLSNNTREDAVGVLQIRPIFVYDVNRIISDVGISFTLDDRWDVAKSFQMAQIYFAHYCEGMSPEQTARCFNGGPNGYKKASTQAYWLKVQKEIARMFDVR
jgi:hypothetical protein